MNEYLLTIIIVVIGFFIVYYGPITQLRERVIDIEIKLDLFWNIMEKSMAMMVHSPHNNPRLDYLLERLMEDKSLILDEAEELRLLLKETDMVIGSKRLAAAMLLARTEQRIYDLKRGK